MTYCDYFTAKGLPVNKQLVMLFYAQSEDMAVIYSNCEACHEVLLVTCSPVQAKFY